MDRGGEEEHELGGRNFQKGEQISNSTVLEHHTTACRPMGLSRKIYNSVRSGGNSVSSAELCFPALSFAPFTFHQLLRTPGISVKLTLWCLPAMHLIQSVSSQKPVIVVKK